MTLFGPSDCWVVLGYLKNTAIVDLPEGVYKLDHM